MRRLLIPGIVLGLLFAGTAASAGVHDDDHGGLPEHPHVLLINAEVDFSGEEPVLLGADKCVDLAANRSLPLNSHHHNVHFGTAGENLFANAGHIVAPTAPFPSGFPDVNTPPLPWSNCEELLAFFGLD